MAKGEILSFRGKQISQVHKVAKAATKAVSSLGMVVVDISEVQGLVWPIWQWGQVVHGCETKSTQFPKNACVYSALL